jgi:hypothetical protein
MTTDAKNTIQFKLEVGTDIKHKNVIWEFLNLKTTDVMSIDHNIKHYDNMFFFFFAS